MNDVRIERVGVEAAPLVIEMVARLLRELGEEGDETGDLDTAALAAAWAARADEHCAFVAYAADGAPVGVATVSIAFALYAVGDYGIINEMWVAPEYRSAGVGARLIGAIRDIGRARGWRRIDVTAPESERWARTREFYEREGFVFTGPKLKVGLDDSAATRA